MQSCVCVCVCDECFYDNNLLFVENATYATKMARPAAKISELTYGPLKAPGCVKSNWANEAIELVSAADRWALRKAAKLSSSKMRML